MTGINRIKGYGLVDTAKPARFTFDGKAFEGLEGDTLASALLAHDVHLMGRSFKYHRPRGVLSAGPEEPNALVDVIRDEARVAPNTRATMAELYEGLTARSQNHWPSLKFDLLAGAGLFSKVMPSGFYYKTFMWPRFAWHALYEPVLRHMAGLGQPPKLPDPDNYAHRFAHCDVLVVGAGPCGLAAAIEAADTGARVILCDERDRLGGSLLGDPGVSIDGQTAPEWTLAAERHLAGLENVRIIRRGTAFGYYMDNMLAIAERLTDHLAAPAPDAPRERLWQVRAKHVVLATGAIERPLTFAHNDRPGVMLASAGQTYLNRYGVAVGSAPVIVTDNDSAYLAAFDLARAGREVRAIVDLRIAPPADMMAAAKTRNIEVVAGHAPESVRGAKRAQALRIRPRDSDHATREIPCDAVLMSGGWTPSVHLHSQSGGKTVWNEALAAFLPGASLQAVTSVGACAGLFGLQAALSDAFKAGGEAARGCGFGAARAANLPQVTPHVPVGEAREADVPAPISNKAFVDFQNDVTAADIALAVGEGYQSIEHVKRYTTLGMATDQGKTSNLPGLGVAAGQLERAVPDVGHTTFRPPYTPVTFGTLAAIGQATGYDPLRKTPVDAWAEAHGAVFEPVGQWRRARYFPQDGEDMNAAVRRECRITRSVAGVFDASTLGKIEVCGPDAAEFMNRLYSNPFLKLGVGRCRYGLMLRDDGFIFDDGVIGRIAEDRFHVTTTSSGAPAVFLHMEDYLQTEFPELSVSLTSTTEQWGVIAVQGPKAREIIAPFIDDIDLSAEALPHMSVCEGHMRGVPIRLFRVSFTGELGFEINLPSDYTLSAWELIWEEAQKYGACLYGTEAMHVMRAEKGYIIVGQDTDGTVTPQDAGLAWAVGKAKTDFVGMRSLTRPAIVAAGRKQLVGLKPVDAHWVPEEGAQVLDGMASTEAPAGHVTSAYWSETLGRSIALALVPDGLSRPGEHVFITAANAPQEAVICGTQFYDPEGERLNV